MVFFDTIYEHSRVITPRTHPRPSSPYTQRHAPISSRHAKPSCRCTSKRHPQLVSAVSATKRIGASDSSAYAPPDSHGSHQEQSQMLHNLRVSTSEPFESSHEPYGNTFDELTHLLTLAPTTAHVSPPHTPGSTSITTRKYLSDQILSYHRTSLIIPRTRRRPSKPSSSRFTSPPTTT